MTTTTKPNPKKIVEATVRLLRAYAAVNRVHDTEGGETGMLLGYAENYADGRWGARHALGYSAREARLAEEMLTREWDQITASVREIHKEVQATPVGRATISDLCRVRAAHQAVDAKIAAVNERALKAEALARALERHDSTLFPLAAGETFERDGEHVTAVENENLDRAGLAAKMHAAREEGDTDVLQMARKAAAVQLRIELTS